MFYLVIVPVLGLVLGFTFAVVREGVRKHGTMFAVKALTPPALLIGGLAAFIFTLIQLGY
jgi:hypothetical protein